MKDTYRLKLNILIMRAEEFLREAENIKRELEEPEFKVGMWIKYDETGELFRIVNMTGDKLWFISERDRKQFLIQTFVPLPPEKR